jgi:hypothetical protein
MTDRYHSLTVVLDSNIRADDAEPMMNAIRMFVGVQSVAGNVADPGYYVAETRVRHELRSKLFEALEPKGK